MMATGTPDRVTHEDPVVRRTAAHIDISDMAELIIDAKGTKPWFRYIIEVRATRPSAHAWGKA
jgi:hypothetical protein